MREQALRALQIDNTLADAWAQLAGAEAFYDHDWADAERDFKYALELNPDSGTALMLYSFI